MNIPKDPKERFQYYFDITTGLDEKYQKRIDKIQSETFSFDPEKTTEYKKGVEENRRQADYMKKRSEGSYAELSEGYDNSMQEVAEHQINTEEKRANSELYNGIYKKEKAEWQEDKLRRIEAAKKRYAAAYGNAYYNMLKANEEISRKSAK